MKGGIGEALMSRGVPNNPNKRGRFVPHRAALRVASAGLCLTLLAGCGGRLSREQFIARADEIGEEIDRETEELGKPRTREEFEEFVERGQEITIEGIERIRQLEPPEADEERVN